MPAVLAHWVVARDVADRFIKDEKEGCSFFRESGDDQYGGISKYIYLGASGPDIPYFHDADMEGVLGKVLHDKLGKVLMGVAGKSKYADILHYNKQGEFILQLVIVAKELKDGARRQRTMAYALGHATHVAADSVVHPYVNCFAGAYHNQSIDVIHRISELHQDSYVAKKYFNRDYIDEGDSLLDSWTDYLPDVNGEVNAETQEVFSDIVKAFRNTHDFELKLEYLRDSYENFYHNIMDIAYDTACCGIPKEPHESLVHHDQLVGDIYYPDLLTIKAVDEAEKACQAVITLYNSELSEDDQNEFRSIVRNWNMDTGYWIDITLEDNELKIIWRHRWC